MMNRTAKKELMKRGLREGTRVYREHSIWDILSVYSDNKENDGNWHKARSGEKL